MAEFTPSQAADLWSVAEHMAEAAGAAILPHFRSAHLDTDNKLTNGFDPVTIADRAAETAMRDVLADLRPDDGILGEEYGTVDGTSGLTWVLDPIDGTRSFISGTPTWGVLIALSDANGPFMGMIDQPYVGERFMGGLGRSHWTGPGRNAPLGTKSTTALSEATLFSTFPEIGTKDQHTAFQRVARAAKLTRYGCDCYAYALLAAGQIDLVIEAGLNAYDVQAPIAVIQSAGGVVTDWEGRPAHEGGTILAAATPDLHARTLALLKG